MNPYLRERLILSAQFMADAQGTRADSDRFDAALAEVCRQERIEAWAWFLSLLEDHGYKDQPIWHEARSIARRVSESS
jgi:hypothetical protein